MNDYDYESHDALGLAELLRRGEVTPTELLDAALVRVEEHNSAINAVVHRMEDSARQEIAAGLPNGPFKGVPYLLKDLYLLAAGEPTSNGSGLYHESVPDHDSTLTKRLRAAGLVFVAKTNTPEFGLNVATEPVVHGPTRNPWDLSRSPGGSSGGSAAAVAAGIVPAAHATDGGGSIRIPASNCGLFGLKTTRARNPMGPDVGEGWSGLSTAHAVTRSVRDSAALLDATHGPAPGDPYHAPSPAREFSAEVGADAGQLRIALWTESLTGSWVDPECRRAAEETAHLCESLGHRVEPAAPPVSGEGLIAAFRVIMAANIANTVDMRLEALGRGLADDDVELVTRALAEEGRRADSMRYARALFDIHAVGRQFADFFNDYDIVLSPTLAEPPLPLGTIDMMSPDLDAYLERLFDAIPFTPLFNVTGCPAATLPLGWSTDGLPLGVQIGARFGDEATLIRLASQVEATGAWHVPLPVRFDS